MGRLQVLTIASKIKTRTEIVSIDLNPDDWELYSATINCDRAAAGLNKMLMDSVNSGKSCDDVREAMQEEMKYFREYGADDSEPHYVLDSLLNIIFPHINDEKED